MAKTFNEVQTTIIVHRVGPCLKRFSKQNTRRVLTIPVLWFVIFIAVQPVCENFSHDRKSMILSYPGQSALYCVRIVQDDGGVAFYFELFWNFSAVHFTTVTMPEHR